MTSAKTDRLRRANASSYDMMYGSLAGVIVFLLWLWITNLALLFGAELDAEIERGRETKGINKARAKADKDIQRGRELRGVSAEEAERGETPDG